MRARNIKPSFFKDEDLGELPFEARLLFAGLWCMADRAGRLEERPKRIKAEIFPFDDISASRVGELLGMLADHGFILRYSVDGENYVLVVNFTEHQNPHVNEKKSTIPPPPRRDKNSTEKTSIDDAVVQISERVEHNLGKQDQDDNENSYHLQQYVKNCLTHTEHSGASTVQAQCDSGASTVRAPYKHQSNPADSLIPDSLIPDPGFLIPDSQKCECILPESVAEPGGRSHTPPPPKPPKPAPGAGGLTALAAIPLPAPLTPEPPDPEPTLAELRRIWPKHRAGPPLEQERALSDALGPHPTAERLALIADRAAAYLRSPDVADGVVFSLPRWLRSRQWETDWAAAQDCGDKSPWLVAELAKIEAENQAAERAKQARRRAV